MGIRSSLSKAFVNGLSSFNQEMAVGLAKHQVKAGHTMATYQQLREYFTEQQLDDAAVIARHSQHRFPDSTYAEIFIEILAQMRLYPTAN